MYQNNANLISSSKGIIIQNPCKACVEGKPSKGSCLKGGEDWDSTPLHCGARSCKIVFNRRIKPFPLSHHMKGSLEFDLWDKEKVPLSSIDAFFMILPSLDLLRQ